MLTCTRKPKLCERKGQLELCSKMMKSHGKAFLRIGGLASSLRSLFNEDSNIEMMPLISSMFFSCYNDGSTRHNFANPLQRSNSYLYYWFREFRVDQSWKWSIWIVTFLPRLICDVLLIPYLSFFRIRMIMSRRIRVLLLALSRHQWESEFWFCQLAGKDAVR